MPANLKGAFIMGFFVWPWFFGTYLAVQFGAANPSLARTITGWVFEAPWIAFLGFISFILLVERSAARKLAAKTRAEASAVPNNVGAVSRAVSDNRLGLGLVIVGAVAMAISAFLPFVQPTGAFRMVEHNTLIQHGGSGFIALALGIAASGYRVSQGRWSARWVPIVLCVLAAGLIVLYANGNDERTLYPVGPDGNPITTQPGVVANLGIAIYIAGAGVAAAFVGSVMLFRSAKQMIPMTNRWTGRLRRAGRQQRKKCPDCAKTVLAYTRICKHCGYRFAPAASSEPATESPP
jgi:hypothetical protein